MHVKGDAFGVRYEKLCMACEVMYEKWCLYIYSDVWNAIHVKWICFLPCETQSVIIPWFPVICHRRMTSRAAERTGWNCRCSPDVRHCHLGRRAAGSATSALAWPSWPRRWPDRRRVWRAYWGSDGTQRWRRSRERSARPVDPSEGSNSNLQHWIQTSETSSKIWLLTAIACDFSISRDSIPP